MAVYLIEVDWMRVGINAGFGDPIGHELGYISGIGFDFVRQDILPTFADDVLQARVAEFVNAPVMPLFLLAGGHMKWPDGRGRVEPHEIAALGRRVVTAAREAGLADYMLEVGNEPDLAHADYSKRPQDFGEAVRQAREAVRAEGFDGIVISGGISNLNERGLDYLAVVVKAQGWPSDITVGFHRYPTGDRPQKAHDSFKSRDAEWQRLTAIAAGRPLACTEVGHHTAERKFNALKKGRISDADAADHFAFDLDYFKAKGCRLVALYQLNDGQGDTHHDRYGIRRLGGQDKPVVARVRQWIETNA